MVYRWQPDNVPAARHRSDEVIERIQRERDAYEAFHAKLSKHTSVPTTGGGSATTPLSSMDASAGSKMDELRDHYRETVMQVPHIAEEYTFESSVTTEFPDLVADVFLTGMQLTPPVFEKLETEARESVEVRTSLLTVLNQEAEYLDRIEDDLIEIGNEAVTINLDGSDSERDANATQTRKELLSRCDEMAQSRQEALQTDHVTGNHRFNLESAHEYLYGSMAVTHPVLADVALLGEFIRDTVPE